MPPPVSDKPTKSCENYPICTSRQANIRLEDTGRREWQPYCVRCSSTDKRCEHPDCSNPVGPPFHRTKTDVKPTFCTTHYTDPCHDCSREWFLRRNARIGWHLLSINKSSATCYPRRFVFALAHSTTRQKIRRCLQVGKGTCREESV